MEYIVRVVGIGPGSPDYLLPAAYRVIQDARILVGSKRALETFAKNNIITKVIDRDIHGVLTFIKKHLISSDVVVMVSGDPGFYSMLAALKTAFNPSQLSVIPGISSVQLAFARIGELWHDAILTSLHGREQDPANLKYEAGKKLGILTDNTNNPKRIAQILLSLGWPETCRVWLCENLSYENERIMPASLAKAIHIEGFSHCVMVVSA